MKVYEIKKIQERNDMKKLSLNRITELKLLE